ncbi:MAG: ACP synthase, partial [Myxococcaceae bacterium]
MSELHVPEISLRRMFAGELVGTDAEEVKRHAGECAACRAKLRGIEEEQARFEQAISLERFRAGVERAARGNSGAPRSPTGIFVMAAAAAV